MNVVQEKHKNLFENGKKWCVMRVNYLPIYFIVEKNILQPDWDDFIQLKAYNKNTSK